MSFSGIAFVRTTLLSGFVLGSLASAGQAQFNPAAAPSPYQPPSRTEAAARASSLPSGYTPAPVVTVPAPAYGYPEYKGPAGGYLSGGADVINAQGQFLVQRQQANLTREQVQQAKIDSQRKKFDEWMYERALTPTLEEERERARLQSIQRSLNNPPLTEIWSGKALNDLLLPCQRMQGQGVRGPNVPLGEETLRHINLTSGTNPGGLGVLKDAGQLKWPVALRRAPYEKERKNIDDLAVKAVKEAQYGQVNADTISGLNKSVEGLTSLLKQNINETGTNDYIQAKRYLNDISSSISTLDDPNVANYVTRKWSAKGNSVGELVAQMSSQGLKFAPAAAGDEAAYSALHNAFVAYETGLSQMASR